MGGVRLFYGSTSGNTQHVAKLIAAALGENLEGSYDIAKASPADLEGADKLILGTSTWDMGALQKDWVDFLTRAGAVNLAGKQVALFGLGDANGYSGLFVNALHLLHDFVVDHGAQIAGHWPTAGYTYVICNAVVDDTFVGLVIDQENQSTLTHERVAAWVRQLMVEFGFRTEADDALYGEYNPPPRLRG